MQIFPQIAQLFPLVLAPGVVALARRQRPLARIDGPLLVGLCVIGAAVLWTLLLAVAYEEPVTRSVVARGILMGLASVCADTWATRKAKAQEGPAAREETPSAAPTVAAPPDLTPRPDVPKPREMQLNFDDAGSIVKP
jgi:hypothetical protein